ncbi:hypothetical protein DJ68_13540 [Halorubrum sp. C3]|nr:hypothetical protein DJ68_13540 [Halorubrum sp. C3]
MDRRKFIASVGVIASGSAAAVGTGAFSSTEATRNVDVKVADDSNALLGLQPTASANGNYVDQTSNDALAINLTGSNNNRGSGIAGGEGLNANAVTSIADVFEIKNQGTQTIEAAVTPLAYGDIDGQEFPPDVDGALAVFLIPQNPDEIEVEVEWGLSDGWIPLPVVEDVSFIGIKDLSPGQKIKFSLLGVVVDESSIGSSSINDQLEIAAQEV